jgi:YD repeat-containing protein
LADKRGRSKAIFSPLFGARQSMRPFMIAKQTAPLILSVLTSVVGFDPTVAKAATSYVYDPVGRLTAVIYDDGVCATYSYDANGNRTSSNIATNAAGPLTWGSGLWGCSTWSSH